MILSRLQRTLAMLGAAAAFGVGVAVLYRTSGAGGNASLAQTAIQNIDCESQKDRQKEKDATLAPLVRGDIAALSLHKTPRPAPDLTFLTSDGASTNLIHFQGKTLLVNLWATWCAPCRTEMPVLDALQASMGDDTFQVIAINIDTRDPERPRQWFKQAKLDHLTYYSDPEAATFRKLQQAGVAVGMPVSLVIDQRGCQLGAINGPADWAGEDAMTFLRALQATTKTQ